MKTNQTFNIETRTNWSTAAIVNSQTNLLLLLAN